MKTSVAVGSTVAVDSGVTVTPGEQPITEMPIINMTVISEWKRENVLDMDQINYAESASGPT